MPEMNSVQKFKYQVRLYNEREIREDLLRNGRGDLLRHVQEDDPFNPHNFIHPGKQAEWTEEGGQAANEPNSKKVKRTRGVNKRYPPGKVVPLVEATVGEVKEHLGLSDDAYGRYVRDFRQICHRLGIRGKTLTTPEHWDLAIQAIIRENQDIRHAIETEPESNDSTVYVRRRLLDVICRQTARHYRRYLCRKNPSTEASASMQPAVNNEGAGGHSTPNASQTGESRRSIEQERFLSNLDPALYGEMGGMRSGQMREEEGEEREEEGGEGGEEGEDDEMGDPMDGASRVLMS